MAAALSTSSIHVTDPVLVEGDSGTTELVFTVSRRGDTSGTVTLDWSTADGTAITNMVGLFTSSYLSDLLDGTYTAEVIALSHATYIWKSGVLDPTALDGDADKDGLPDETHVITPRRLASLPPVPEPVVGVSPETLRAARLNAGLSQGELAKKFGADRKTIGTWERQCFPPLSIHARQLRAFVEEHSA